MNANDRLDVAVFDYLLEIREKKNIEGSSNELEYRRKQIKLLEQKMGFSEGGLVQRAKGHYPKLTATGERYLEQFQMMASAVDNLIRTKNDGLGTIRCLIRNGYEPWVDNWFKETVQATQGKLYISIESTGPKEIRSALVGDRGQRPDIALLYDHYIDPESKEGKRPHYNCYTRVPVHDRELTLICRLGEKKADIPREFRQTISFKKLCENHDWLFYAGVSRDHDFTILHDRILKDLPYWANPRFKLPTADSLIDFFSSNKDLHLATYIHEHGLKRLKNDDRIGSNIHIVKGAPRIKRTLCAFIREPRNDNILPYPLEELIATTGSSEISQAIIQRVKEKFTVMATSFGENHRK